MNLINRMMKGSLLLALVLALVAPLAQANPGNGRAHPRDGNRQNGPQRQQQQQQPNQQREEQQRPPRREESNAGEQQRQRLSPEQRQRLSPEERRQLRRDIHDAGRDIYRR